jgi:hypothetical protein
MSMIIMIGLVDLQADVCVGKLANCPVKSLIYNNLAVCHAKTQLAKWQTGAGLFVG